jgi:hypothetical protein
MQAELMPEPFCDLRWRGAGQPPRSVAGGHLGRHTHRRADLAWSPYQDFLVLGHSQFVLGNDRNRRCTGVTLTFC